MSRVPTANVRLEVHSPDNYHIFSEGSVQDVVTNLSYVPTRSHVQIPASDQGKHGRTFQGNL